MHKKRLKKYFQGSRKFPQAHEIVCRENKNDVHIKILLIEEGVYRACVENFKLMIVDTMKVLFVW